MEAGANRGSLPSLLGGIALAIAGSYLVDCLLTAPADGQQLLLGMRLSGLAGWLATLGHVAFFLWLGVTALRRRMVAVWAAVGYAVYLIETIWVYSLGEGGQFLPSVRSMLIVNAFFTAMLLTVCRAILARRAEFDA